jgi:hypothetical protein
MAPRSPATRQSRRQRPALLAPVLVACLVVLALCPPAAAGALPNGFRLYTSRILPYRIAYPPGWQAQGSISGTTGRTPGLYYDAESFIRRGVGSMLVEAEVLPAGVRFTAAGYAADLLLDELRTREMEPGHGDSATQLGATRVGGSPAYLLEVRHGTGQDQLRTTEAVFVAAGRGWIIGCTMGVTGAARAAVLRDFTRMLGTFQVR